MTAQQQLLRYFAAEELHIQHYLRRHFEWHENALWLEDIPARLLEPLVTPSLSLFSLSLPLSLSLISLKTCLSRRLAMAFLWPPPALGAGRLGWLAGPPAAECV